MNVSDLFTKLSFGELSNLSISNEGSGEIPDTKAQSKIIGYTNEALLRLYSRFILNEKELILRMIPGVTNYWLLKRFADSNCKRNQKHSPYIMDRLAPFEEDVIKVLEVRNNAGLRMPLNDTNNSASVFTPKPSQLQIPVIIAGASFNVIYQAKHKPLQYGVMEQEVNIPDVLLGALTSFIAHKVFSHMNGQENTAKSREHFANYEMICDEAEENDLVSTSISTTSTKLEMRGWI